MNDPDYGPALPRRRVGPLLVILLTVFLLGMAATVWIVRHWTRAADAVLPPAAAPVGLAQPAQPAPATPLLLAPAAAPVPVPGDSVTIAGELGGRLSAVESRVGAIEAQAEATSGDADRAEALLVAFAARRALDRGRPLGYLEGLLRDRFGASDAPSVALVIAAAQRPVTLAGLQDGLAALAPDLTASASGGGWWQTTRRELANLFVVRRADAPSAVPSDRLARATRALDQGQVDTAATEIARMPGATRAAPWLASARRYLLARGALDRLETVALLRPAETSSSTN